MILFYTRLKSARIMPQDLSGQYFAFFEILNFARITAGPSGIVEELGVRDNARRDFIPILVRRAGVSTIVNSIG